MKVKVKKCSNPTWWYAGMIGQEFDVVNDVGTDYEVSIGCNSRHNYISKEDCEVINDVTDITTDTKTIKISLDTARKLYEGATEATKNWLLDNFSKVELEPKKGFTWGDSFDGEGFCVETQHPALILRARNQPIDITSKRLFKTKEQAESALAFAQLTHIVAKYNEGKSKEMCFYTVYKNANTSNLCVCMDLQDYLGISFIDKSDAILSMEVNKDLWKQYWMTK